MTKESLDAWRQLSHPIWAKRDEEGHYLPLVEHLLDVAACFAALIDLPHYRRAIETVTGHVIGPVEKARLCVLAALHDVGKINAAFLRGEGGHLLTGFVRFTEPALAEIRRWGDGEAMSGLLVAALSHHGVIVAPNPAEIRSVRERSDLAPEVIATAAGEVLSSLRAAYPAAFTEGPSFTTNPRRDHLFAGLLTLADQIGSGTDRFPIQRAAGFLRDGVVAVSSVGLDPRQSFAPSEALPSEAFGWPAGADPSPAQCAIRDLPVTDRLVLLESETGSGKTEAALLRFDCLLRKGEVGGLYFAVPTRSAASQLQARVHNAAQSLWGAEATLAIPGYLRVGNEEGRRDGPFSVTWNDLGRREEARWAAEASRKFLAAPVAVGTIDQALASVTRQKWAHMRGAALARSFLVIDEVHASDAYMARLMAELVREHLALGGHILLMSATLAAGARNAIFAACGASRTAAPSFYPALTVLRDGAQRMEVVSATGRSKAVEIEVLAVMKKPAQVARAALDAARQGGRVLVIRNSVRAAVDTLKEILQLDENAPVMRIGGIPALHHSRFASRDRRVLDAAVEQALGKGSSDAVIVVGTQTLEQSLDIDADVLLTDICPIDVLLQRIGRLHRHAREDRPLPFIQARCQLLDAPDAAERELRQHGIGRDRAYPELAMIGRTRELAAEGLWSIPEDNRRLVEAGAAWDLLRSDASHKTRSLSMISMAEHAILDRTRPLTDPSNSTLANEASTRLGDPSHAICFNLSVPAAFGGTIREIQAPVWMTGTDAEKQAEVMRLRDGSISFRFAARSFIYNNFGLQLIDGPRNTR